MPADPISTVPYVLMDAVAINGGGGALGGDGATATRRCERVTELLQLRKTTPSALVTIVALLTGACSAAMNSFSSVSLPVENATVTVVKVTLAPVWQDDASRPALT